MPLDTFVPDPACRMEVVGDPDAIPPVQREVQQALDRAASKHVPLQGVERFAFYERAKSAFAIVPPANGAFTAASSSRRASSRRSSRPSARTDCR